MALTPIVRLRQRLLASTLALLAGFVPAAVHAADARPHIVLASTTSTEASGLLAHLLPKFTAATGIEVRVVAVGTGQALALGRRGDADAVLVHDRQAEERFVAAGHARSRHDVMHNDFVLIGPAADPGGIRGSDAAALALARIARQGLPFVSRGDRSGTHAAELRLWQAADLPVPTSGSGGYQACGCGMGQALNMAAASGAHVLADRGTWLAFRNRRGLDVLVEGDRRLFNPYGVMVVSPQRHPHVKADLAERFVQWLTSVDGQQAIAAFRVDGQALFFPASRP